ncbi:hypothetical protein PPYR_10127 [Photinus pyralis]|uniref:Uncharacterized protein n=1 Tax=Photinus pyralis TaxID=7054 RepID=A0A5N4AFJ8_PHOPY|nr:hypothetical protein PPYR_10127 [Photinus pyralis]
MAFIIASLLCALPAFLLHDVVTGLNAYPGFPVALSSGAQLNHGFAEILRDGLAKSFPKTFGPPMAGTFLVGLPKPLGPVPIGAVGGFAKPLGPVPLGAPAAAFSAQMIPRNFGPAVARPALNVFSGFPKPLGPMPVGAFGGSPKPLGPLPVTVFNASPKPLGPLPVGAFGGSPKPLGPMPAGPFGGSPKPLGPMPAGPFGGSPKPLGPMPAGPFGGSPQLLGPMPVGVFGGSPQPLGPMPVGSFGVSPKPLGPVPVATPFSAQILPRSFESAVGEPQFRSLDLASPLKLQPSVGTPGTDAAHKECDYPTPKNRHDGANGPMVDEIFYHHHGVHSLTRPAFQVDPGFAPPDNAESHPPKETDGTPASHGDIVDPGFSHGGFAGGLIDPGFSRPAFPGGFPGELIDPGFSHPGKNLETGSWSPNHDALSGGLPGGLTRPAFHGGFAGGLIDPGFAPPGFHSFGGTLNKAIVAPRESPKEKHAEGKEESSSSDKPTSTPATHNEHNGPAGLTRPAFQGGFAGGLLDPGFSGPASHGGFAGGLIDPGFAPHGFHSFGTFNKAVVAPRFAPPIESPKENHAEVKEGSDKPTSTSPTYNDHIGLTRPAFQGGFPGALTRPAFPADPVSPGAILYLNSHAKLPPALGGMVPLGWRPQSTIFAMVPSTWGIGQTFPMPLVPAGETEDDQKDELTVDLDKLFPCDKATQMTVLKFITSLDREGEQKLYEDLKGLDLEQQKHHLLRLIGKTVDYFAVIDNGPEKVNTLIVI